MKKFLMLLAFAGLTTAASAQEPNYPTLKHQVVTNSFWSNWFVDAGFDWNAFYSSQEHGQAVHNKNPFCMARRSMGADLSVGKWATPVFGMRLKAGALWGTQVNAQEWAEHNPTFNSWTLSLQPMVNLTNLFGGYKPRVWNISVYGGMGIWGNRGGRTDEQQKYIDKENGYSWMGTVGVLNTFNITKRFHINLDVSVNTGEADSDGNGRVSASDHRMIKTRDHIVDFSLGLGVNLGKVGWDNAPDVDAIMAMNQAQLDALNAALADAEAENARLKALIANHKCPEGGKVITEFASTSASVFFNINSTKIASKKDLVNVKEIAEVAKAKGAKLVVTGYADSKTGSAARNQTLSEGRAQTVVEELVKMGVNRSNIEVVAKGGVADLDPYDYNRRAVVSVK